MTTSTKVTFQYPPGATLTVDLRLTNSSTFVYSGLTALTAYEEPPAGGPYAVSNYFVNVPTTQNGTFDFLVKSGVTVVALFTRPLGCSSITDPQRRESTNLTGTGQAFSRLFVDRLVYGNSRVTWKFNSGFTVAGPYTFWLQASYAGHANAVDWVTVSGPHVNVTQLDDTTRREQTGKLIMTHYRVLMSAGGKLYTSEPSGAENLLNQRDFLLAKEMVRKELLRRKQHTGIPGYLLRRFRYGVTDPRTTFAMTNDIIDTYLASSWGTGYQIGYHPAIPLEIEQQQRVNKETRGDGNVPVANTMSDVLTARIIGSLDMVAEDVWVNAATDERFYVDGIATKAAIRGVPIVRQATLRMLPFTHPVYRIPVDGFNP